MDPTDTLDALSGGLYAKLTGALSAASQWFSFVRVELPPSLLNLRFSTTIASSDLLVFPGFSAAGGSPAPHVLFRQSSLVPLAPRALFAQKTLAGRVASDHMIQSEVASCVCRLR